MANEIQTNLSVNINTVGNTAGSVSSYVSSIANPGFIGSEQVIATSATELDLGAVGATPLLVCIRNLDQTNYVQIDANNSFNGFPQKILPNQAIYLAPETGTIYAKANTAPVNIYVVAA